MGRDHRRLVRVAASFGLAALLSAPPSLRAASAPQAFGDEARVVSVDELLREQARRPRLASAPTDTFILFQHTFDDPDGSCQGRSWHGENLASRVYAHVSGDIVLNSPEIAMGTQALWFGADTLSASDEVRNWVQRRGYGNYWSQRLESPSFTWSVFASMRLVFDGRMDVSGTLSFPAQSAEFFAVQALNAFGNWEFLTMRVTPVGLGVISGKWLRGTGDFTCEVNLNGDGNEVVVHASPARLRIVFQTNSTVSPEDGRGTWTGVAGAVVDNLRIQDSLIDVIPATDFEEGTTEGWTVSAMNGVSRGAGTSVNMTRDIPPPMVIPALRGPIDGLESTCSWANTDAGDTVAVGGFTHLVSPWFPKIGSSPDFEVRYGSRPAPISQARLIGAFIRGKRAGDSGVTFRASTPFITFGPGTEDVNTSYFPNILLTFSPTGNLAQAGIPDGIGVDSLQIVFEISDQGERFLGSLYNRTPSRLPYISEVTAYQLSVDADYDGVPDDQDACPSVDAGGQDVDADGCPDPTATLRHVESWRGPDLPIRYRITQAAHPTISDGSDLDAIRSAFARWQAVDGANVPLVEEPLATQTNAAALDGVNLITFEDDFVFPANVLAITPTTSFTRRATFGDRIVLPGQIVDSDLIFNTAAKFRTPGVPVPGAYDLESVATHEIGHLLGLSHSGVLDATMFPVLQDGTLAASLEDDDRAAVAAAYPGANLATAYGSISGTVTRGVSATPVPGAMVFAVRLSGGVPFDTTASDYTAENGGYRLERLPPGSYAVRILPLDGSIPGVVPEAINSRVASIAVIDFLAEWWSVPETLSDDPAVFTPIAIAAGQAATGIDLHTNLDVTPPTVVGVVPAPATSGVPIDAAIRLEFSEPITGGTLGGAFRLREQPSNTPVGGRGQLVLPGAVFVFTPDDPLRFGTSYTIEIGTGLADRAGNPLASAHSSGFSTEIAPAIAIGDIRPRQASTGSLVTLTGDGFDPHPGAVNLVLFTVGSGNQDSIPGTLVTRTSMVVRVPSNAATGVVKVVGAGPQVSNQFNFTVLPPAPQSAPQASGAPVALAFAPLDVALAPDGLSAIAVGAGGLAAIRLDTPTPEVTGLALPGGAQVALTPDGARAFVSRPEFGDVVEVGASPAGGDFGAARDTIPTGGEPHGVVVGRNGTRLYAADRGGDRIFEIDTDPASSTRGEVRFEHVAPGAVFSGSLTADPAAPRLFANTSNLGLIAVNLSVDSTYQVLSAAPSEGGVAVTPDGNQVYGTPSTAVGALPLAYWRNSAAGSVVLGGSPRDVTASPLGGTVYVVNSAFSRIQVLQVSGAGDPRVVAEVGTGLAPRAISISADGARIAVANQGGSTVSLYSTGASPSLARLAPAAALPGDAVTVRLASGSIAPGTTAEIDESPVAILDSGAPDPDVAAFAVPAGGTRDVLVSLAIPPATRTLGLPLRVLEPVTSFGPRSTGIGANAASRGGPADQPPLGMLRTSPDGRLLAVLSEPPPGFTGASLDLFSLDGSQGGYGQSMLSVILPGAGLFDAAFAADGTRLWVLFAGAFDADLRAIDTDPASLSFGQSVITVPGTVTGTARALAADPGGRWLYVGTPNRSRVVRLDAAGALLDSIVLSPPASASPLLATPDGRHLIAGGAGDLRLIRCTAASMSAVASTPVHGSDVVSLAIPTRGQAVVGRFAGGEIGVWNLDPDDGALGLERSFGVAQPPPIALSELVPGSDGTSVIAGCANCDSLLRLEVTAGAPVALAANVGRRSPRLARVLDGRTLWLGTTGAAPAAGDPVEAFALGDAGRMFLVSGGGQQAGPNTVLPLPVRVQVTDAAGLPQGGVGVSFTLADTSHGSLASGTTVLSSRRVTDVNGEAEVSWTLPGGLHPVTLDVVPVGLPGEAIAVTAASVGADAQIEPQVVSIGPATGATHIHSGSALFIRFSQPMDYASTLAEIKFTYAGSARAGGTLRLEDGGRLAIYQPPAPLPFATACTIAVDSGAVDLDGQKLMTGASSTFTSEPQPMIAITALHPESGPPGAPVIVSGQGFSRVAAQNTVLVNGHLAAVETATPEGLLIHVPEDALTGPVTVQVGSGTSNPATFHVLPRNPVVGYVTDDIPDRKGIRDLSIHRGGARLYLSNPATNSVSVKSVATGVTQRIIPAGLQPQALLLLPDGSRAYVANSGSNDVTVIDTDSTSATYHQVIRTIPVGREPVELTLSAFGPTVIVVNAADATLSLIDANPGNGTAHQVTSTVNTGSRGTQVVVTPDGTRAYVATANGLVVVDLASKAVTSTINTGSRGTQIVITPDGAVLFVATESGEILAIDIVPGSPKFNRVTSTVNTGSRGTQVVVSPDGALLYVTLPDANAVLVFEIQRGSDQQAGGVSSVPATPVNLALLASLPTGSQPVAISISPDGSGAYVANEASGTITVISLTSSLPVVDAELELRNLTTFDLEHFSDWVTARIEPRLPVTAAEIVAGSLTLDGLLGADSTAAPVLGDGDFDGTQDLTVRFAGRTARAMIPTGDGVVVSVTGSAATRLIAARDTIDFARPQILSPPGGEVLAAGRWRAVTYELVGSAQPPPWAHLLVSLDGGASWTLNRTNQPNTGEILLHTPAAVSDSARVAVVQSGEQTPDFVVTGSLAVSDLFQLAGPIDAASAATPLALAPVTPTPSAGSARIAFALPVRARVSLEIFDLAGRRLRTLIDGERAPGWHEVEWRGDGESGRAHPGLYFVRMRALGQELRRRLVWMR